MLCNRLHGLVRANKLNGMEARVMDHADGRLVVAIDDGLETQVRVKHANVKLLCRLKVLKVPVLPCTMSPCVLPPRAPTGARVFSPRPARAKDAGPISLAV